MAAITEALVTALNLHQAGRLPEAETLYRQILAVQRKHPHALHMLGLLSHQTGRHEAAAELIVQAISLMPDDGACYSNLCEVLRVLGRAKEAQQAGVKAVCLRESAPAYNNLGLAFKDQGMLDDAVNCYRSALKLNPDFSAALSNLGVALREKGELDEAIGSFRKALALEPHSADIHSNLINVLLYHLGADPAAIHAEHRRWSRQFAEPLESLHRPHANGRDPERRLRLGYLSPGFCDHVVGRNVLPILERHDRDRFELFCYSGSARPDAVTKRFQNAAHAWRNIAASSDQTVADHIRADGIDILVDLTLHTAGQRLAVFARKPAPVQVTWAGYPGTTGVDAIDYRLTDPYLDPPGASPQSSSEAIIHLPHSFWCYQPLAGDLPVTPLPALTTGRFVFGSLNSYCKVNEAVIALWSRVLCAVQDSRLILLSHRGSHRERALAEFLRHGVAASRVCWFTPSAHADYLRAYHHIDLGLDTFPYNGHTTSLDSAWMGVPVITLVGDTRVGRGGLSQAMNLALPELVAHTPDDFVQRAVGLATDLPRLSKLRQTLRPRMEASPILDAAQFTLNIESAYRAMWRNWCVRTAAK